MVKAFFGTLFAIVLQTAACYVLYRYDIPNPNIILFVFLSAMLVQFGYPAGIAAGAIAFVYSVFFFSVDHGMTSFTAENGEKLLVASIGILAKIPPYSRAGASPSELEVLGNNALLLHRQHVCLRLD